jgi:hypothetical protein
MWQKDYEPDDLPCPSYALFSLTKVKLQEW